MSRLTKLLCLSIAISLLQPLSAMDDSIIPVIDGDEMHAPDLGFYLGLDEYVPYLFEGSNGGLVQVWPWQLPMPAESHDSFNAFWNRMYQNRLKKLDSTETHECGICLSVIDAQEHVVALPCKHELFHVACIKQWLENNRSCPLCRVQFDDAQQAPSERTEIV